MSRRGFTLIELLVVIAIIAILAAILFPVFARAREKARQASCESNLKQLSLALIMYAGDYDQRFPNSTPGCNMNSTTNSWWGATGPYVKNGQVLMCPSANHDTINNEGCAAGSANPCSQRVPGQTGLSYGYPIAIGSTWRASDGNTTCCSSMGGRDSALIAPAQSFLLADSARANIGGGLWAGNGSCAGSFTDGICAPVAFANYLSGCPQPGCGPSKTYAGRLQELGVSGDVVAPHNGGANIAFADGHVKWFKNDNIKAYEAGGPIRFNGYELYQMP